MINITFDLVRSGQPRPYADHEYVARITWKSTDRWWSKPRESDILNLFEAMGGCSDRKETRTGWWQSYLDYCTEVERDDQGATYEVRSVTPFTD